MRRPISGGDGSAEIVQIAPGQTRAPNLEKLLADPGVLKLFHFGRFDMAVRFAMRSESCRRRSIAPRSPRNSHALTPIAMA